MPPSIQSFPKFQDSPKLAGFMAPLYLYTHTSLTKAVEGNNDNVDLPRNRPASDNIECRVSVNSIYLGTLCRAKWLTCGIYGVCGVFTHTQKDDF